MSGDAFSLVHNFNHFFLLSFFSWVCCQVICHLVKFFKETADRPADGAVRIHLVWYFMCLVLSEQHRKVLSTGMGSCTILFILPRVRIMLI